MHMSRASVVTNAGSRTRRGGRSSIDELFVPSQATRASLKLHRTDVLIRCGLKPLRRSRHNLRATTHARDGLAAARVATHGLSGRRTCDARRHGCERCGSELTSLGRRRLRARVLQREPARPARSPIGRFDAALFRRKSRVERASTSGLTVNGRTIRCVSRSSYDSSSPWSELVRRAAHADGGTSETLAVGSPPIARPATPRPTSDGPMAGSAVELQPNPHGFLYASFGDGGFGDDPVGNSQEPRTLFGKVIRIDVNGTTGPTPYAIPASNPYAGNATCPVVPLARISPRRFARPRRAPRSTRLASETPGASRWIAARRLPTFGSATSARIPTKRSTASSSARITAGTCAKGRSATSRRAAARARASPTRSSRRRDHPACVRSSAASSTAARRSRASWPISVHRLLRKRDLYV